MKRLQILGSGCRSCQELTERTKQAADALGLECTIEKVTDFEQMMTFGIASTPALVVDGVVKVSGRVPTVDAIKSMLG
jgi:small redox-active disulfide protein 2